VGSLPNVGCLGRRERLCRRRRLGLEIDEALGDARAEGRGDLQAGDRAGGLVRDLRRVAGRVRPRPSDHRHLALRRSRDVRSGAADVLGGGPTPVDQHRGALVGHQWDDHVDAGAAVAGLVAHDDRLLRLVAPDCAHPLPLLAGRDGSVGAEHAGDGTRGGGEVLLGDAVALLALLESAELPLPELEGEDGEQPYRDGEEDPTPAEQEPHTPSLVADAA